MRLKSAKNKGRRLELEVAKALRDAGLDKNAGRMPLSGAMQGFKSDIHTILPMIIECKNQETWSPLSYMDQASRDAEITGKMPVVIMSKNRLPDPYVMMKMTDWIEIMQRAFIENKSPVLVGANSYSKKAQLRKG